MNQHANEFWRLYSKEFLTQEQIGAKFGRSRTWVNFVLRQHPDYRPISRAERTARRNQAIREAKQNTDLTGDEIAKAFGVSRKTVIRACRNVQSVRRE